MATISGEIVGVGTSFMVFDPTGSLVTVKHASEVVGAAIVDNKLQFEIQVPDTILGELELVASIPGAAPVLFDPDGDISLIVFARRSGDYVI